MKACYHGHKDVVKLLLKYSNVVDIDIRESVLVPEQIKNLIKMHSMTVQK